MARNLAALDFKGVYQAAFSERIVSDPQQQSLVSSAANGSTSQNNIPTMSTAEVNKIIEGGDGLREQEILAHLHKVQISLYEQLLTNRMDKVVQ